MDRVLLINDQWRHRQHLLFAFDLSFYYYQHFFYHCFLTLHKLVIKCRGPEPFYTKVDGHRRSVQKEAVFSQSRRSFDGSGWKIRPFLSLYWTNESKTEIESLRRLLHIWPRTFESIIIRISLFWFSFDGKQFCSIKIISLKGSTLVHIVYRYQTRNFFSVRCRCDNLLIELRSPNLVNIALFDCNLSQHLWQIEHFQHLDAFKTHYFSTGNGWSLLD